MNFLKTIAFWAKNDKNPTDTLDRIKAEIDYRKKMVRINPVGLFKQCRPADFELWATDKKELEKEYSRSRGFSAGKEIKHVWSIPQFIYNIDPQYWHEITRGRQYSKHPEFLITNPYAQNNRPTV